VKILHINENYGSLGGAERCVMDICGALVERGWEQGVVASSTNTRPGEVQRVRVHTLAPSFGVRSTQHAVAPLKRILDAERPDVVHLHNIQYFLGPRLLRVLHARAPVIQTVHDARAFCPRWMSKIIPSAPALCTYPMGAHCFRHGCYPFHRSTANVFENLQKFFLVGWEMALMRKLDRILVYSGYMREQLLLNGFPSDRLVTLPMFLPLPFAPPERSTRKRRIAFAGRIDESKGVREFLASLVKLSGKGWTAQLIGDGPFLGEANAIVIRERLQDRVQFLGRLDGPAFMKALSLAYVVVMPSLIPESFGLVGLEALACGTPVVAFDSGGVSEWLKDGKTGFLVPWGDIEMLAHRLAQLLADEKLAGRLGRQGQDLARHFDKAQHMDTLCQIYTDAAARRRRDGLR
jgi:glycosyltransferase involved in cell wall biosynthesis